MTDMLEVAREYLNRHYTGLYNVTRMKDYADGSRLYGTPLWHTTGPMVSVRVHPDGTVHGTPEHARAARERYGCDGHHASMTDLFACMPCMKDLDAMTNGDPVVGLA